VTSRTRHAAHSRTWAGWQRQRQRQLKGRGKPMFKLLKVMILDWLLVSCALILMLFVDVSHDKNGFNLTMSLQTANKRLHWLYIATEPMKIGKPTGK
jgi:hypothetical protein